MNVGELVKRHCQAGDVECKTRVGDLVSLVGVEVADELLARVGRLSGTLEASHQHKSASDAEVRRLGDRLADRLRRPAPARKVRVKLAKPGPFAAMRSRASRQADGVPPFIGALRSRPQEPSELPELLQKLRKAARAEKSAGAEPANYRGWLRSVGAIPDD